jgi:hypothetical protein
MQFRWDQVMMIVMIMIALQFHNKVGASWTMETILSIHKMGGFCAREKSL